MKYLVYAVIFGIATAGTSPLFAKEPATLQVKAEGIGADGFIEPDYAFCVVSQKHHSKEGTDKSIGLSWSKGPASTKSYAIIAVDPDVPTVFDDAGKEGKTVSASLPRKDFYHWILLDIPAGTTEMPAAADSHSISLNGKSEIKMPYGVRGVNDYAPYFASKPARRGVYAGYDGPCPPWNDELVHHYHFRVFALDVASLGISGAKATGPEAMKAISKHILAKGEVVGQYTLNPALKK